jgi:putative SOS response-associated peptidase YedK
MTSTTECRSFCRQTNYARWLDPELNDKKTLQAMLKSYPAEAMESNEVSPYVSNARNEGPQCIENAWPS